MEISCLKGVGEKRVQQLAKLGLYTVEDLLEFYPRDYVDYTAPYTVQQAPEDMRCVVKAAVVHIGTERNLRGGKRLCRIMAGDETGSLELIYFNDAYTAARLRVGCIYYFWGKVSAGNGHKSMVNPTVMTQEQVKQTPIVPIYPQTGGISSTFLFRCVREAFECVNSLQDNLPLRLVEKYRLCSREQALRMIHMPRQAAQVRAARRRLIYEELLALQLGLLLMRGMGRVRTEAVMRPIDFEPFWLVQPFAATQAQKRAVHEIAVDLTGQEPMNRLLQGDVGSGKTLVAAAAAYMTFVNGYQTILMAPTEILAVQHAKVLGPMLEQLGARTELLTAGLKASERRRVLQLAASGELDVLVGTHAVLSQKLEMVRPGLVITDEQHRFGVRQRGLLAQKGVHPHTLVMSATPIPRTLGLLMFGDLDISILDELPAGRVPVKTFAVTGKKRGDLFAFLHRQLQQGRQVYLVCPVIEESESGLLSVTEYYREVACPLLPGWRIGVMHGRLKAAEKTQVMQQFQAGELDVLVCTTVIEVGVDVPNANCIVIENAERYGLSALHQLRGRVGRGAGQAFCVLVSDHTAENVKKRLSFLCKTTDGFEIAKFDLETRGPGDFFGSRQHGLPQMKIADLMADSRVLYAAQADAVDVAAQDPELSSPENAGLGDCVRRLFAQEIARS